MKENDAIEIKEAEIKKVENEQMGSNKTEKNKGGNFFKDWIVPIICAVAIAFALNKFAFINVYIPSGSMIPTLNINDKLIVTRIWNKDSIKRGDILVFTSHELNETVIKRVIGIPGDHVEITDGIVKVNGEEIDESYVKNNESYNGIFDVPEGKLFFLGDNRAVSYDARYWDNPYIDKDDVQGKAQLRYYPIKEFGILR
ncbi:signal peptidase I [uncultured Clostridium sp.]|uniref:signal peptidase I n=1 Tax=uncultured Clostridium sp. TaxID=59620 RepID=UPI0025F1DC25|nr:signal peptidase I [uncultured Clostridium sp.]